jgi:hypothetical protein
MKVPLILACIALLAAAPAVAQPGAGAPPTPNYELLFADEFDGDRVNERDWNFRLGPRTGTGVDGLAYYPNDPTAPGRLGANSGLYDAVGDVTLTAAAPPPKAAALPKLRRHSRRRPHLQPRAHRYRGHIARGAVNCRLRLGC